MFRSNPDFRDEVSKKSLERFLDLRGEDDSWDFKETLELATNRSRAELARDVMAFSNTEGGGHIIIGVDKTYKPVGLSPSFELDTTNVCQAVDRYIDGDFQTPAATYDVPKPAWSSPLRFGMIYVPRTANVAVLTACHAAFPKDGGKMETLFEEAEIFVRRGAQSIRANGSDLRRLFRHASSQQEILAAVTTMWDSVLCLRQIAAGPMLLYSILMPDEYEQVYTRPTLTSHVGRLRRGDVFRRIDEASGDVESRRPFLGEALWSLFHIYRAFTGRLLDKVATTASEARFPAWDENADGTRDTYMYSLLEAAIPDAQLQQLVTFGSGVREVPGAPERIRDALEQLILAWIIH